MAQGRRGARRRFYWARLPQRELLEVRLCDLGLRIERTWLNERIARLREELAERGLRFTPHFWLSDEWFSPADVGGVALPFYLAHPRLIRLERDLMLQVEGATIDTCMQYLRHEVGHAVLHAYQLNRRRAWQRHFGKASVPYPEAYRPNPASRRFVHHLPGWYAQSHPEEDFAETFAVWLRPRSNWRKRYQDWPARKKLEYVDQTMRELNRTARRSHSRARPYSLTGMRMTLGEYYRRKRDAYRIGFSDAYDRDLRRLFEGEAGAGVRRPAQNGVSAARFLRENRREIRQLVARWTGDYEFTLNAVLNEMIGRCRELQLTARGSEKQLMLNFAVLLTVHGMTYLYRHREWHAM